MRNQWFKLWSQSFEIASGAPEVIRKRLTMFHAALSSRSLIEANRMVVEKMVAMNQSMWSLWRDSMSMRWPPGRRSARLTPTHAARSAAKAFKPIKHARARKSQAPEVTVRPTIHAPLSWPSSSTTWPNPSSVYTGTIPDGNCCNSRQ